MKDNLLKILLRVIAYDVVFLIFLRLAVITIPHVEQELIYYVNLNFHFIIACLAWMNYKQSNVNKPIILIFSILYTPYIIIVLFYIFTGSLFSDLAVYIIYHIAYIYINTFQLFITFYVFFLSLYPYKTNKYYFYLCILTKQTNITCMYQYYLH
jgi:hypothetical protein